MYDLVYDPPMTAEDVLDGEELRLYRAEKAHRIHSRSCRDHFCERCNPPAEAEMPPEMEEDLASLSEGDFEAWVASMEVSLEPSAP